MANDAVQLELFRPVHRVERLEPRRAIGRGTQVRALYRVRYAGHLDVHQVYHDRHGWYCAEHGRGCDAVRDAVAAAEARRARRRGVRRPR